MKYKNNIILCLIKKLIVCNEDGGSSSTVATRQQVDTRQQLNSQIANRQSIIG